MKTVLALRQDARQIFNAALKAANAAEAVTRHVKVDGEVVDIDGHRYSLRKYRKIVVVGAGKASAQMCRALEELIGDWLCGGIIIVKYGYGAPLNKITVVQA